MSDRAVSSIWLISASTSLLPRAIQLLKQRAPGVLVSLRVGQMDQLFPALAVGDVDGDGLPDIFIGSTGETGANEKLASGKFAL